MSDLIDRQAAINAICEDGVQLERHAQYSMTMVERKQRDVDILEALPPVSFENHDEIKSYSKDTISRQQAIDALADMHCKSDEDGYVWIIRSDAWARIDALPSAQPERKMGKWIYNSPVTMKCNQCGFVIKDWDWHRFKCCPNCGANMKGEQDD